jgi:hypothetical protein
MVAGRRQKETPAGCRQKEMAASRSQQETPAGYRKNAGAETLPRSSVKLSIPSMAKLELPHPMKK